MTGKYPPPIGGRTLADDLRDDLGRCEEWVTQFGAGVDGLALLRLLDHVTDELERLEQRGVDLRAERGRLEPVLGQLCRRKKALVTQLGAALAAQRPAEARWWWYLDEQVAADRRRRLKQLLVSAFVGLSLLALGYLIYDRFLAPPPHIRQANAHFFEGEQAVIAGELVRAIEQFEATLALDPERVEAYLWLGVLNQATDNAERATAVFERARAYFEGDNSGEARFLLRRGLLYLILNDTEAANKDALAAIEEAPDWPEGYFLLGNVAEQVGDLKLAIASFQRTSELAEAAGDFELQATARMRLSSVVEILTAMPEQ